MYALSAENSSSMPMSVLIQVAGQVLTMEVDTGAAVSILSETVFRGKFPQVQLKPSSVMLRTYTGEAMKVMGVFSARVRYKEQDPCELDLYVVAGSGPCLLGRSWLERIRLDWHTIAMVAKDKDLQDVGDEYQDIFATHDGGQLFTTLGLTHAYHPMELDPDLQNYVVLNTHRGLSKYKGLPFGIASASAQFQRAMDQILQGMDQVTCYLDNVLITGATREERLRNLAEVLRRFREHRVRLKLGRCCCYRSERYLGTTASKPLNLLGQDIPGKENSTEQPIAFTSRALSCSEQNYLLEVLSLILGLNDGYAPQCRVLKLPLNYCSTPHTTVSVPPSSLFLHGQIRTRLDLLRPNCESQECNKQSQQTSQHDQRAHERPFFVGQTVMTRNLRPGADWVPVVERLGPLSYLVEMSDKLLWKRPIDLLREWEVRNPDSEFQEPDAPDFGDSLAPPLPVVGLLTTAPPTRPDAPVAEAAGTPATPGEAVSTGSGSPDPHVSTSHHLLLSFRSSIQLGIDNAPTDVFGDFVGTSF